MLGVERCATNFFEERMSAEALKILQFACETCGLAPDGSLVDARLLEFIDAWALGCRAAGAPTASAELSAASTAVGAVATPPRRAGPLLRGAVRGGLGSGKSTTVQTLLDECGGIELAFAEPLYRILYFAQDVYGFARRKDRAFLQYIGTEWGRAREIGVWLRLAKEKIEAHAATNIFFSDLRFPNEDTFLLENGFTTVLVVRPRSADETSAALGNGSLAHASETALDGVAADLTLTNDSTLAVFRAKILALIDAL